MSEILDEIKQSKKTIELPKDWRHLEIVVGIVLIIAGGAGFIVGIQMEIVILRMKAYGVPVGLLVELRTILMLFLVPITMIAGAVLLIAKKRVGWIISLASYLLLTAFTLYIFFYVPGANIWAFLISILSGSITFLLVLNPYRKHYLFKIEDLFYIAGVPSLLFLVTIFI
ncbi:MAG: hypothetical protein ACJA0U_000462 [Salibacteraceae bacterium]|jgi:hypothetical protein